MVVNIVIESVLRPLFPKCLPTGESNVATSSYISWQEYARLQQDKYRNVKRTPGDLLLDDYIDKTLEKHMTLPDDWPCDPKPIQGSTKVLQHSLPPSLSSLTSTQSNIDCTNTCVSMTTSPSFTRSVSSSLSSSLDIGFKRSIDHDKQNYTVFIASMLRLMRSCKET